MINWDDENWGGRVTYAANGSWVPDKHDVEDEPEQD